MSLFPFGKAALSILLLTLLSGLWLAAHPAPHQTATLVYWTFAKPHYDAYQKALPAFEAAHPGVTVDLELVSNTALASRLQAALLANLDVPDLCEVEISQAGSLFRGPQKDIGFSDLTDRLHQTGLYDQMVQARFSPYTSRGRIFGLPHDVHPVQIAYRRDLFEKLGIDASKLKTWDDFIAVGRRVTIPGQRYMVQFSDADAGLGLEIGLFQRGGGYFDPAGNCTLDNESRRAGDALVRPARRRTAPHRQRHRRRLGPVLDPGGGERLSALPHLPGLAHEGHRERHAAPVRQDGADGSARRRPRRKPDQHLGRDDGRHHQALQKSRTRLGLGPGTSTPTLPNSPTGSANSKSLPRSRAPGASPFSMSRIAYWSGQKTGARYIALAPQVPYPVLAARPS